MNEKAKSIVARWNVFVEKVHQRWKEILAEADPGFDEVMHTEIVDPAAMSGATSAFQARVHGLNEKIAQAWAKIEGELDSVIQDTEDSTECAVIIQTRSGLQNQALALQENTKQEAEILRSHKEAKAARLLEQVAKKEMSAVHYCSHCGAEITSPTPYKATSVTCSHCQAVNSVLPGIATGMYYQGGAFHHLAHESALEEWILMTKEEKHYQSLRHKTQEDLAQFEEATSRYWKKYCQTLGSLNPDWNETNVSEEYKGKMSHFYHFVAAVDQAERNDITTLIQFAENQDAQGALAWLKQNRKNPGSFAEAASEATHERNRPQATAFLLELAYQLQNPTDPKAEWLLEKKQDLQRYIPVRL